MNPTCRTKYASTTTRRRQIAKNDKSDPKSAEKDWSGTFVLEQDGGALRCRVSINEVTSKNLAVPELVP